MLVETFFGCFNALIKKLNDFNSLLRLGLIKSKTLEAFISKQCELVFSMGFAISHYVYWLKDLSVPAVASVFAKSLK